jgi:hypothetical protein
MQHGLDEDMLASLRKLYEDMESAYDRVAAQLQLTCSGCPDNCCNSYFRHHTYIEWCYLSHGLSSLADQVRKQISQRARDYQRLSQQALARGEKPQIMCPLNLSGRCQLYRHRMMICRTHGVPASLTRPDGKRLRFPGCFRCQELVDRMVAEDLEIPVMERTELFRRLVVLEQRLLAGKKHLVPRVKMTIADMIISGPPTVAHCSDTTD